MTVMTSTTTIFSIISSFTLLSLSLLVPTTTTMTGVVVVASSDVASITSTTSEESLMMKWHPRSSYDNNTSFLGRHHPITFANETHGFLMGGSTANEGVSADLFIYSEDSDSWIDASHALLLDNNNNNNNNNNNYYYPSRTFGYGVVLDEPYHPKAYLGFGSGANGERLNDWWEFDMTTLEFRELARFPGEGRHHPSVVAVFIEEDGTEVEEGKWQIHVGLGDGLVGDEMAFVNFNDYWAYHVDTDVWTQLPDFPSSKRHHPFYFGMNGVSYVGMGHSGSYPFIERDFYSITPSGVWSKEPDFESYAINDDVGSEPILVTTEARVAGTQFSIVLPNARSKVSSSSSEPTNELVGSVGFILSGDGDDHDFMAEGEFHAFYPSGATDSTLRWRSLTPHPGASRWAPGSFVMRGTARAYFTSGYDRTTNTYHSDVWSIDLSPLFRNKKLEITTDSGIDSSNAPTPVTPVEEIQGGTSDVSAGVCTTQDQCNQQRLKMSLATFVSGDFPTKGCFSMVDDNGEAVAYWSSGNVDEIVSSNLPEALERIMCDATVLSGTEQANTKLNTPNVYSNSAALTPLFFCSNIVVVVIWCFVQ